MKPPAHVAGAAGCASPSTTHQVGAGKVNDVTCVGLFQELVLVHSHPDSVLPRPEWHLPPEGVPDLPLAHGLQRRQVRGTPLLPPFSFPLQAALVPYGGTELEHSCLGDGGEAIRCFPSSHTLLCSSIAIQTPHYWNGNKALVSCPF